MTAKAKPSHAAALAGALVTAAEKHEGNEANFRRAAERALEKAADALGIEVDTVVERMLARGPADAVFNRLVVEWEPPGGLAAHKKHPGNKHAVQQLQWYIDDLAEEERREKDRLVGVACDGRFMIFAQYRAGHWSVGEPVVVDELSAQELLDKLAATQSGRALTAANLLRDFGPGRPLTRSLARALLDQLAASIGHDPDGLTARMYRQWESFFAVATGVVGAAEELKREAREPLAEIFGLPERELNPAHALFALQSYFAVVTKLIALLALSLFVEGVEIRVAELKDLDDASLLEDLGSLQHGEPFRAKNLANVVEPDVFGWYLSGATPAVCAGLREALAQLATYDPKTLEVSPEDARDLLKDLYQGLLPRPSGTRSASTSHRTGSRTGSSRISSTRGSPTCGSSTRPAAPARSSCSRSTASRRTCGASVFRRRRSSRRFSATSSGSTSTRWRLSPRARTTSWRSARCCAPQRGRSTSPSTSPTRSSARSRARRC